MPNVTTSGSLLRQVEVGSLDVAKLRRACNRTPGCTSFDSQGNLTLSAPSFGNVTYNALPQRPENASCWGAWVSNSSSPHNRWLGGLKRNAAAALQDGVRAASVFNATYLLSRRIKKQGNSALASAGIFVGERDMQWPLTTPAMCCAVFAAPASSDTRHAITSKLVAMLLMPHTPSRWPCPSLGPLYTCQTSMILSAHAQHTRCSRSPVPAPLNWLLIMHLMTTPAPGNSCANPGSHMLLTCRHADTPPLLCHCAASGANITEARRLVSTPISYDARQLNLVVRPPGDQAGCGACVTYSMTSAAESALGAQLKLRSLIKLSEHDLFFCGDVGEGLLLWAACMCQQGVVLPGWRAQHTASALPHCCTRPAAAAAWR